MRVLAELPFQLTILIRPRGVVKNSYMEAAMAMEINLPPLKTVHGDAIQHVSQLIVGEGDTQ